MDIQKTKQRMYGIGMGEGYIYVSITNLLIYFMMGSTIYYKNFFIGSNITIALVGIGLWLYSKYLIKVE